MTGLRPSGIRSWQSFIGSSLGPARPSCRGSGPRSSQTVRLPASGGLLAVSGVRELHASDKPNHEQDDQHEAKSPTDPRPAVAIIAIVSAPAAEQQDQQDDDEDCAHGSPHRVRSKPAGSQERCIGQGYQGVAFLAALSMACPVAERSWPAPAVVWQALRSGAAAMSESAIRPTVSFLYMLESFMRVRLFQGSAGTVAGLSPSNWRGGFHSHF